MEIIKGIKWDPSDAVDKEIYEMQVKYIKQLSNFTTLNILVLRCGAQCVEFVV